MDVVISGASGLIGSALSSALRRAGHRPVALVRRAAVGDEIEWDPANRKIDVASLEGIGGVVHLAGAGIADHRWSTSYKDQIKQSRVMGTTLLATTLAGLERRPAVLLSGSAIGYYGSRGDEVLDEASAPGSGFLSDVCVAWEHAAAPAAAAGIRTGLLRTGIVLSAAGGALRKQLPLFKFGLGGRMGSGQQWQSWISIDDEVGAIISLLTNDVSGPVNLTAPNPVNNREFTQTLASVVKRPAVFPVPSIGPRMLLGTELAESLLFEGARVMPSVLQTSGYHYSHPHLEGCLRALLGRPA